MIIDFHTHIFPETIAKQAVSSLSKRSNSDIVPSTDGTRKGLIASMKEAEIEKSCICNIATKPGQSRSILQWSKTITEQELLPLATIYPGEEHWEEQLDAFVSAGAPGIKLHPQYQNFIFDDRAIYPLYEKISEKGIFLLTHSGFDPAYPNITSAHPERIAAVAADFPELKIIAAHMGGWNYWNGAIDHLVGKQIFFDTSFMHLIPKEIQKTFFSKHPKEFFVYGSDSPWNGQKEQLHQLESAIDNEKMFHLVTRENWKQLITL